MAVMESLFRFILVSVLIKIAMATDHAVGGTNGKWDTSTDLKTWASAEQFFVGDNLVFQYTPMHDVVEVSKADYDSCSASNPIRTYNGGATTIPLASPGKRYFICGTLGHCSQGMNLEVDTLASSTPASVASAPAPALAASAPAVSSSTTSPTSPTSTPVMAIVPAPIPAESPQFFPEASSPDAPFDTKPNSPALSPFPDTSINESVPPPAEPSPSTSTASTTTDHLQTSLTLVFSFLMIMLAF